MKQLFCKICNENVTSIGRHAENVHDMSLENYTVLTEFENVHPKCQCGFCKEKAPWVQSGRFFQKFIPEHNTLFYKRVQKHLKEQGEPKCVVCQKVTRFRKDGIKISYCSSKCVKKVRKENPQWGWSNKRRELVKIAVLKKYGVDHVMKVKEIHAKATANRDHAISRNKTLESKSRNEIVQRFDYTVKLREIVCRQM